MFDCVLVHYEISNKECSKTPPAANSEMLGVRAIMVFGTRIQLKNDKRFPHIL